MEETVVSMKIGWDVHQKPKRESFVGIDTKQTCTC